MHDLGYVQSDQFTFSLEEHTDLVEGLPRRPGTQAGICGTPVDASTSGAQLASGDWMSAGGQSAPSHDFWFWHISV
jgi:hypothetical protein